MGNFVKAIVELPSPLPELINDDPERGDVTPCGWIVKILTDHYDSKGGVE